jgi:hypothetical protein
MPITKAIFVDNYFRYLRTFKNRCNTILGFRVGGIDYEGDFPLKPWSSKELIQYEKKLSPKALQYKRVIEALKPEGEIVDFTSGITEPQTKILMTLLMHMKRGSGDKIAAMFDFDRTLTLFEGFHRIPMKEGTGLSDYIASFGHDITAEGFTEYLLGGHERARMIRSFLHHIANEGIPIVIITNNRYAIKHPGFFKDFFPGISDISVLCGHNYKGNKQNALKAFSHIDTRFATLFGPPVPPANQFLLDIEDGTIRIIYGLEEESVRVTAKELIYALEL